MSSSLINQIININECFIYVRDRLEKEKERGEKLVSFPCEYCKTLFLLAVLMPSFHSGPPGIRPYYEISLEVMSDKIFCPCSVQEHFPKFVQRQYGVIFSFFFHN